VTTTCGHPKDAPATVLFSGGRDSSLAACLLAEAGAKVHLVTTFNGAVVKGDIADYRVKELTTIFPDHILSRVIIPTFGLFRRVALASIEADFERYKYNLIPVGDSVASHAAAIVYNLKNSIRLLASGFTKYEAHYPEQEAGAVELMRALAAEFGIAYVTPVYDYENVNAVKYRLFDFGVSTKSLEGTSLFADTFSTPPPSIVHDYITSKLQVCREYIGQHAK
jgi:hypothetical protein